MQGLKDDLGHDNAYIKLINALSQIIAKLDRNNELANMPKDRIWSNLSERGMKERDRYFMIDKDKNFKYSDKGWNKLINDGRGTCREQQD